MKTPYRSIFKYALLFGWVFQTYSSQAQCSVNFGSSAGTISFSTYSGGDIVRAVSGEHQKTASFDVWADDSTKILNCSSPGGNPDFTMQLGIIPTFDAYGGRVIDSFDGVTHDLTRQSNGLRGTLPFNSSGSTQSSTGDVRGYKVKVEFASHVRLTASNFQVMYSSGNSAGSVFETTCVQFLKRDGSPYAPAEYLGFYDSASNDRIDTICPSGTLQDTSFLIRTSPWFWSGQGTFAAQSVATVSFTNRCKPGNGSNGSFDDKTVYATSDAGLQNADSIGGFIFTVLAEDISVGNSDDGGSGSETGINSTLTSTLIGFGIPSPLPVSLVHADCELLKPERIRFFWSTADEINNSHFTLYQLNRGQQEWLAEVQGNGNSHQLNEYELVLEPRPDIEWTFLLSQTDFDGTEVPLKIFHINQIRSQNFELRYLNEGGIKLVSKEKMGRVILRNSLGICIKTQEVNDEVCRMDMDALAPGIYILEMHGDKREIQRHKFLWLPEKYIR